MDEQNGYDSLSLNEMALALENSLASKTPFKFIGFDACLMGTVETAYVLRDYADYMIASQDQEAIAIYQELQMDPQYTEYLINFGSQLTGEPITQIDLSHVMPTENEDGDFEIVLTPEELESLMEINFTLWEPVEEDPGSYYMLGISSNVTIREDGTVLT